MKLNEFLFSKENNNQYLRNIASWFDSVGFVKSTNKVLKNNMEYIFLNNGNELRIRKDNEYDLKCNCYPRDYYYVVIRVDENGKLDIFSKSSYVTFWHTDYYVYNNKLSSVEGRNYQYNQHGYFDFNNPIHQRCVYNAINRGLNTKKPLPFIYDPNKYKHLVYTNYAH